MRKKIFLFVLLCTSLVFIKCDSDEQTLIEINEEQLISGEISLENWVESNSKVLVTYNRKEISAYPRTIQKAILNSFPPEKRKNLWQSKIDHLLSFSDFSKEEEKYLLWFVNKFEHLSYEKATDENLSQEMYDKVIMGIDKFGWSKELVHKMFFTIGDITNNEDQQKLGGIAIGSLGDKPYCECLYDLGCPTWDCDSGADCDDSPNNPHTCGIFGNSDCNGNCD